jgi:hypothetical protein
MLRPLHSSFCLFDLYRAVRYRTIQHVVSDFSRPRRAVFKRRKGLSNRTRSAMLAVSVVMYAVSAIHWTLGFAIAIPTLRTGKLTLTPQEALAFMYLPIINVRHSLTA